MGTVTAGRGNVAALMKEPDHVVRQGHLASVMAEQDTDVVLAPGDYRPRTVAWGHPWMYECPAYWVARAKDIAAEDRRANEYSLGESLAEEVVACLLGGFGVTYELNVAAFRAVRDAGLISLEIAPDVNSLVEQLRRPLSLSSGRTARYRFPNQKASRIANALARLSTQSAPADPMRAREWLLSFDGVGPKTASWIVRNRWPEAEVAIVDIHVWRAATACGVFAPDWNPSRDYWQMEAMFVEWARHGGVSAAALDATIWAERAARARRPLAVPQR